MPLPIDPSMVTGGAEWQVAPVGPVAPTAPPAESFGQMLSSQVDQLGKLQTDAAGQARDLATGTASDPQAVVMSVERARLAMQLASQVRTKAVEGMQEIFHTQV